jgi:hypothetical protein
MLLETAAGVGRAGKPDFHRKVSTIRFLVEGHWETNAAPGSCWQQQLPFTFAEDSDLLSYFLLRNHARLT